MMRNLTVVINDHFSGHRASLLFGEQDFLDMEENWDCGDRLLAQLQSLGAFAGYERWSELTPSHYRLLVMKNVQLLDALSDDERNDSLNPTMASLNFLLLAFAKCLQGRLESMVEMLRIHRVSEYDLTFEMLASLNMSFAFPDGDPADEEPSSHFRIVDGDRS